MNNRLERWLYKIHDSGKAELTLLFFAVTWLIICGVVMNIFLC